MRKILISVFVDRCLGYGLGNSCQHFDKRVNKLWER